MIKLLPILQEITIRPYSPIFKIYDAEYQGGSEKLENIELRFGFFKKGAIMVIIGCNNLNFYWLYIYNKLFLVPKKYFEIKWELTDQRDSELQQEFKIISKLVEENKYTIIK